jgi:hypothetical protein
MSVIVNTAFTARHAHDSIDGKSVIGIFVKQQILAAFG